MDLSIILGQPLTSNVHLILQRGIDDQAEGHSAQQHGAEQRPQAESPPPPGWLVIAHSHCPRSCSAAIITCSFSLIQTIRPAVGSLSTVMPPPGTLGLSHPQ